MCRGEKIVLEKNLKCCNFIFYKIAKVREERRDEIIIQIAIDVQEHCCD
jgi:hypothetical protein